MSHNITDINKTFIIEPQFMSGSSDSISACTIVITNRLASCSGDTEILLTDGNTVFNNNIIPTIDNNIIIGSPIKRFRELNSVSGNTSVWVAQTRVETPILNLGIDSSGNTRQITANNSVIQDDVLFGGVF